jgi:hypothetical protein
MAGAIDKAIAVLAGRQHGYVSRPQLLKLGLTPKAIRWRVQTGWLIPVYAGVYAVGYVQRTPAARAHAAALACGEKAALSHGSAASLWGFSKHWDAPFEVTAPSMRRHAGIKVHRSRTLARRDITRQLGIRVTSPARTVLDNAPRLTGKRLSRFVNGALRTPYLHVSALADVLNRNPDHPGTNRVLPYVRTPTNSPLEDDFLEFARRYGLPTPTTNTHLLGYEIDVLYPRERLIVEVDGYEFHSDRYSFEARPQAGRGHARGRDRHGPGNQGPDEARARAGGRPAARHPGRAPERSLRRSSYGSLKLAWQVSRHGRSRTRRRPAS